MTECLFTYGTLMSCTHTPAAERLATEATLVERGWVRGRLYDLGKWPGLLDAHGPKELVHGEVWLLRSAQSFEWLDAYEGIRPGVKHPEYRRESIAVAMPSGSIRQAWVYVYQWTVDGAERITSGRWQDRCRLIETPPPRAHLGHMTASSPAAYG